MISSFKFKDSTNILLAIEACSPWLIRKHEAVIPKISVCGYDLPLPILEHIGYRIVRQKNHCIHSFKFIHKVKCTKFPYF